MSTNTSEPYTLIRSRRRTVSLTVTGGGGLVVRAPLHTPVCTIERFMSDKSAWISAKRAAAQRAALKYPRASFQYNTAIPFLGGRLTLLPAAGKKTELSGDTLLIPAGADIPAAVMAFYRLKAREVFLARAAYFVPRFNVAVPRLRLSSAKTRWGSCSKTGVNLNWALILMPMDILDYVVAHELAHMLHPDHSKAFWAAVAAVMPDYRARRKWLKDNGTATAASVNTQM